MREILYIRLPSGRLSAENTKVEEIAVEYGIAPVDRPTEAAVQRGSLLDALLRAPGCRLCVFVPSGDLHLTRVSVPARQPSKVLQAAPYLLEDQLAEDVESLHFAIGPRQSDGSHPIAIVDRGLMEQWLAPFRAHGLRPERLIPDVLALPWLDTAAVAGTTAEAGETPRWSALYEAEQVTVRTERFAGFVCDQADLLTYLELADPERSRALRVLTLAHSAADYSRIDWPLELLPGHTNALDALVHHLRPAHSLNLLQGEYSQRQDYERYWRPWVPVGVLAAAVIVLMLIGFGVDTWRLGREVQAQEEANLERFRALFPAETRIVNLQVQLDQQMQALTGSGRDSGVFPLLETLTQAVTANEGLRVQNLQFRDGALFLALKASDLQVVERLRGWFDDQRSVALEVQSADAGSEGVQVRIKLTPL